MANERELEPDYYINRPVKSIIDLNYIYSHPPSLSHIMRAMIRRLKLMIGTLIYLILSWKLSQFYR
jgi:hypothetical protein